MILALLKIARGLTQTHVFFRRSIARLPAERAEPDKDRRFIAGYACPECGYTEVGINQPSLDRRNSGWNLRVVFTEDMPIECSKCGSNVPRENWTFAKRR